MNKQVLDYYMHDGNSAFRVELAGTLDGEGVRPLEESLRTALSSIGDRRLIIDITFVTAVDEEGRTMLVRWHRAGAQLVADSPVSRASAESIAGAPIAKIAENTRTWSPFRGSLLKAAIGLSLAILGLGSPMESDAATLKSETVAAWDAYLTHVNSELLQRLRPSGHFLWTFENEERGAKVRSGEIIVAPASGHNPLKVPSGLIHHWMGAIFLPGLKLDTVLQVTRDYDHYQEYYRPSVVESKTIARDDTNDRFSLRIMNRAFFQKTALDADYRATNVRLDERRFYSVSQATRVQEIEDYGQAGEHDIAEGAGGGYIWKLCSIARFEERDGGVYLEFEAIVLSRDIPAAARFIVDPIVRRVSRNSLLTSLQQTEQALHGNPAVLASRRVGISSDVGRAQSNGASFSNKGLGFTAVH